MKTAKEWNLILFYIGVAFVIVGLMLLLSGCSGWNVKRSQEYAPDTDPNYVYVVKDTITASQWQICTDASRKDIVIELDDIGKAKMGSSRLDAEDIKPAVIDILKGLGLLP